VFSCFLSGFAWKQVKPTSQAYERTQTLIFERYLKLRGDGDLEYILRLLEFSHGVLIERSVTVGYC
jgi:hypothetical protein